MIVTLIIAMAMIVLVTTGRTVIMMLMMITTRTTIARTKTMNRSCTKFQNRLSVLFGTQV